MIDKATPWQQIDRETGEQLCAALMVEEEIQDASSLFKVLGDPGRFRILMLLEQRELCVNDIASVLGMSQTAVSHQLKILRHNRLVSYRREGKLAFYSLMDKHIEDLMSVGLAHVKELYK
jgi:DNA-binding transcriptional ArsR family regulator